MKSISFCFPCTRVIEVDTFLIGETDDPCPPKQEVRLCKDCQTELLKRMFSWSYCDVTETSSCLESFLNEKTSKKE